MKRSEMMVWCAVMVISALAVAWLVERRHILTLREELDAWGKENSVRPATD